MCIFRCRWPHSFASGVTVRCRPLKGRAHTPVDHTNVLTKRTAHLTLGCAARSNRSALIRQSVNLLVGADMAEASLIALGQIRVIVTL